MEFYQGDSPYLVGFDETFRVGQVDTMPPVGSDGKKVLKTQLKGLVQTLGELQDRLYAEDRRSILLIFQAMDAAGKDSTIRAVTSGVNPAGFQVFAFKAPSKEELDHDFLWRTTRALPERGRIGVFNRSYYEETLIARVRPEIIAGQRVDIRSASIWEERFASIRDHEAHLARNGTTIIKFWLNVSREVQLNRFLRRIDRPEKNWKFSAADLAESERWPAYMEAYQAMLRATSRPCAPWYAIPADHKPFMRTTVADIIVKTLQQLRPH
ncbi:MAG: PPK2 family polyphosphate kinase [Myxococcota bacterium]|nr:PPK2 family polyphosphate kinase [Myxococcota bacterium]